ncbi:MAG TPA: DUF58 domain-containing protein, partial [Ardenticatenaceae bacterium]|nr:DUF58 domain-containing protein [Ardenticatenaceae bacterium]
LWSRHALRRVFYQRRFSENRAFVGETVTLTLSLTNRKVLPLPWVRVDDEFPLRTPLIEGSLGPSSRSNMGTLVSLASLGWYERVTWRHDLFCAERGIYHFGPATLRASDIFGLFERTVDHPRHDRLIVYPRVEPLERLGMPSKDPFGARRAPQPLFEDPVRTVGVRDYHPEDPLRRVHWKATARTQRLQARVWEPTEAQQLVVLLNVATFERHWEGVLRDLMERTISVAASIAAQAFDERQIVGLVANASSPQSDQELRVLPGRSPDQLRWILEALAMVTSFTTMPIERMVSNTSTRLPWGATLVVVTAVVSEPLQVTLLRLRAAGRRLTLVSLDKKFTPEHARTLEGVVVHHISLDAPARHSPPPNRQSPIPNLQQPPDPEALFRGGETPS